MKQWAVAVLIAVTCFTAFTPSVAQAGTFSATETAWVIQAETSVTTARQLTTTWTREIAASANAGTWASINGYAIYADVYLGSLTNVTLYPAAAMDGNPPAADSYVNKDKAVTITASGNYEINWDIDDFVSPVYQGVVFLGSGTATGNNIAITMRTRR